MDSSSCVSPYGRRGRGALWGSFNRGTNVIHEASPSWPDLLQKVFLPKLSHWWLGFNTWILGDTDIRVYSRLFVILYSRSSYSISSLLLLNFQTVASTCTVSTSSLLTLSSTSCNLILLSPVYWNCSLKDQNDLIAKSTNHFLSSSAPWSIEDTVFLICPI